jgi:thymidylate synthase (FAD)
MSKRVELLDHGYLRLVDCWGREELEDAVGEESIVAAARMSTGKGFLGWGIEETCTTCDGSGTGEKSRGFGPGSLCPDCQGRKCRINKPGDEKLLRYLWENKHATPFEMAGVTIEVAAPIFVFREWHRHRVPFSYNEMSSRYVPLPDLSFVPDPEDSVKRSIAASQRNKQAGVIEGAAVLTLEAAHDLLGEEHELLRKIEDLYQRKLRAGFPKELARTHLSVSRYSKMRASANLRGWLAFIALRSASGAQQEIRVYSDALRGILAELFPRTLNLFSEKR